MENKRGNYIGKIVNDYKIIDKKSVNKRVKYQVECQVCGNKKWCFNAKNLIHGSFCEGNTRKTGSKRTGELYGDYIVISKEVENGRSIYIVKCIICNSIKKVFNLREEKHNESCENFCEYILGNKHGDFIIKKAYKKERIYVDLECLVCGSKRKKVSYKDIKLTFKNTHSKICTIKNTEVFKNKKLVRKLLRTYQNINTRTLTDKAYQDVKNNFLDSTDFVVYVYNMFEKRHTEEDIPLNKLSIDRINPFGNYEKGNVRCLTLSEQQKNKRIHHVKSVETIENSDCVE